MAMTAKERLAASAKMRAAAAAAAKRGKVGIGGSLGGGVKATQQQALRAQKNTFSQVKKLASQRTTVR